MSLRFMLGRAGTGKTTRALGEIREQLQQAPDGPPLMMLVPDQMTFQMEYRLATSPELGGMSRAQVFSFSRLALNVLGQTGGMTRPHVSRVGINMMLRKIIEHRQASLRVYQRAAHQQGFYQMLEEMISEFKRYCFTPQDVLRTQQDVAAAVGAKEERRDVLSDKLHDLQLIYADLEEALAGQYIDTEDSMALLAEKIPLAQHLQTAQVWVDGFYAFTPQELTVLRALLKQCQQVTITLTIDGAFDGTLTDDMVLFRSTALTYRKLSEAAEETSTIIEEPLRLQETKRFAQHPELAHLETNYNKKPPQPFAGEAEGVYLRAAVNRRSEVEGAARQILRLVREEGARFRDIALLVRDLGSYHDLLETIFTDYGIPAFLDQQRTMLHHPLIEFIRSSLDVIEQNWRYEAVFRCVKTELLFPPDAKHPDQLREDMDKLENYVLAHGIHGKRWKDNQPWPYRRYQGLDDTDGVQTDIEKQIEQQINAARDIVVAPLSRLERDLKEAKTAADRCRALFLYLEALEIPQKLEKWRNQAEDAGRLAEAREHDQVWTAVVELLDQMVEMVGDEAVSADVFVKMMETGLDSTRFSLVPPALDQVLIGSLDRTRSVDVANVLILGANDGVLPAKPAEDGMLSEEERVLLENEGAALAPDSRQRLLDEEFFIYLALTGAKERLWVSYPLADVEGKSLQPSMLMNRLKTIFPANEEMLILAEPGEADNTTALSYMTGPRQALAFALGQIRQWKHGYPIAPVWWDVYNELVKREDWQDQGQRLFGGLFYYNRENRLSQDTARQLYGETIQASVSRMEQFESCPFQQFASYGLRLQEREIFRLEAPDVGQLFHSALRLLTEHLQSENRAWGSLNNAECVQLADTFVDQLTPKLQREILLSSNRYHYIARKLKEVVGRTATVLRDHAKVSGFSPVGLELPFGPKAKLPPIRFQLANGRQMEIIGRIDRVDAAENGQGLFLRVIDYKSSLTTLSLTEVYFGLALQMLTYLDVVLAHSEQWLGRQADPAGVLYFHVHNPMLQQTQPLDSDTIEQKLFKDFKMKGLLLADEDVVQMMDGSLASGHSEIVPVGLKKSGGFYNNSAIAGREQFDGIRDYVRNVMQRVGTDLTDGEIDVSPYKLKDKTPCTFCSFKPVCQFDPTTTSNDYRILRPEKDDVMLQKMLQERSEADGSHDAETRGRHLE